jgi:hypothetical protein
MDRVKITKTLSIASRLRSETNTSLMEVRSVTASHNFLDFDYFSVS